MTLCSSIVCPLNFAHVPLSLLSLTDSGHGGQSPDASGKEVDGMDEVIFPVDYDDRHNDDGPSDIIDDVSVSYVPDKQLF